MSLRTAIKSMAWTVGALGLAASVMAQTAPAQSSQVITPYWNGMGEIHADSEQTASRLVAEAPQAHAAAAAAKFTYFMAERDLNVAISNLRSDIESSEAYQTALNDYRVASLRYEQARRSALRELRENPQFSAQSQLVDQLGEKIRDHHQSSNSSFNHVLSIASLKLERTRELTEAETIELAGNADVQMAREDMISAYNQVMAQRRHLERVVRNDSSLIELRAARNQALIAHVAADTYAHKLGFARDQALRFAAFNKVQDRYTPYYGWGYGWDWGTYAGPSYRSTYYPIGVQSVDLR